MTDAFKNLAKGATVGNQPTDVKLPSVEQMRYEMETGDFSPESLQIAQDILVTKEIDSSGHVALDTEPREKSQIEKETDAIMARVTKPVVPLPSAARIKKMTEGVKSLNEAMTEAGEAARKAAETAAEAFKSLDKKPFVPQPHLTQRPFKNKAMYELRDQLRKTNVKIRTR